MANEAPCPNCGAPSPLLDNSQQAGWGTGAPGGSPWGGPAMPNSPQTGGQWEQQTPQMSFNNNAPAYKSTGDAWQQPFEQQSPTSSWQQPFEQQNPMPSWQQPSEQQNPMPSWQQPSEQWNNQYPGQESAQQMNNQSMLPAPYQGGMELQPVGRQSTISLQLVPQHAVEHLLPANPEMPDIVHVAPMYTKPRPIVPKRRVISGLFSVIIVALLLCSAAGYYAKASGTWDNILNFYNGKPVSNLQTNTQNIPDPPARDLKKDYGAGDQVIQAAALTDRVDKSNLPIQSVTIFQPGQKFYLTFSAQPPKGTQGHVTTKWYTNGKFYEPITYPDVIKYDPANVDNFVIAMSFPNTLSGSVEIYWNNTFAQRLYFAVR
ncbi:hypothetical protein [Dictyobacter arantiisoli]|uniref:hypothetical protein n=1 Tax=Dictyobacter arantiisoli TaxID=2014874 RepID=UPI0011ED575D|nr:hypothetical protein [Dictyobacter arantiisoli]